MRRHFRGAARALYVVFLGTPAEIESGNGRRLQSDDKLACRVIVLPIEGAVRKHDIQLWVLTQRGSQRRSFQFFKQASLHVQNWRPEKDARNTCPVRSSRSLPGSRVHYDMLNLGRDLQSLAQTAVCRSAMLTDHTSQVLVYYVGTWAKQNNLCLIALGAEQHIRSPSSFRLTQTEM